MRTRSRENRIEVLTTIETRHWHSPFSKVLRELRQARIVARCARRAERRGCTHYAIYDAFETLVATGSVHE